MREVWVFGSAAGEANAVVRFVRAVHWLSWTTGVTYLTWLALLVWFAWTWDPLEIAAHAILTVVGMFTGRLIRYVVAGE
jgi:hypothetical protein